MKDIINLAKRYWTRTGGTGLAHYRAGETAQKYHTRIGTPNAVITAIVATSIFSTLSENEDFFWLRVGTGAFALLAVVLSATQAFLNFSDRADKHKAAGSKYANLRRTIDLFLLKCSAMEEEDRDEALKQLEKIINTLNTLDAESPNLTEAQFQLGKKEFDANNPQPDMCLDKLAAAENSSQ